MYLDLLDVRKFAPKLNEMLAVGWLEKLLIKMGPSLLALEADPEFLFPEVIEKLNLDIYREYYYNKSPSSSTWYLTSSEKWDRIMKLKTKKLVLYDVDR